MPEVCLVIPCFNEASRLDGRAILALLARDPVGECVSRGRRQLGRHRRGVGGAADRAAVADSGAPTAVESRQGGSGPPGSPTRRRGPRPRFRRLLGRGLFDPARGASAAARRDDRAPGMPHGARLPRQAARLADRSTYGPSRAGPRVLDLRECHPRDSRSTIPSAAQSCSASKRWNTCSPSRSSHGGASTSRFSCGCGTTWGPRPSGPRRSKCRSDSGARSAAPNSAPRRC